MMNLVKGTEMKQVAGYVERKTMLYQTDVEYAAVDNVWCVNHVLGCSHLCGGCENPWCYALKMKRRFKKVNSVEEWSEPKIVRNTLELLMKELPRKRNQISAVFLSFTTDPFMYRYPEITALTLEVIRLINSYGIKCIVLTKGVLPVNQLSLLSPENEYGISLVSMSEEYRQMYEPGAAPIRERLGALMELKRRGFKTWISMEPYPTPNVYNQNLFDVLNGVAFVDKIIFGRTNYCATVSAYPDHKRFYNECAMQVIDFCKSRDIECIIKRKTITE